MQKIKLFSQYNLDALFLKAKNEVGDQLRQWPDRYFEAEHIRLHVDALKHCQQMNLPSIDFLNGRQVLVERIYPASVYQPGLKNNSKVRVAVLTFQYTFQGPAYLLGCCPATDVPDVVGEWYVDANNQQLTLEYVDYEKHPKKTIVAHQNYIADLQVSYESLKNEFILFNTGLDNIIEAAVTERIRENNDIKRMLASLKLA